MATPKTLTATDLEQGKLTIITDGTSMHVERRYSFINDLGQTIPEWASNRTVSDIEFSDLPVGVQNALITINNWTYQQALEKEGME